MQGSLYGRLPCRDCRHGWRDGTPGTWSYGGIYTVLYQSCCFVLVFRRDVGPDHQQPGATCLAHVGFSPVRSPAWGPAWRVGMGGWLPRVEVRQPASLGGWQAAVGRFAGN